MARPKQVSASIATSVPDFIKRLDHPLKPLVIELQELLLAADSSIEEAIKWNVPSFRTSEFFATMQLNHPSEVGLILHFGAKKRDLGDIHIQDPAGLLAWLAKDRARLVFRDTSDLGSKRLELSGLVREWIRYVA